MRTSHLSLPILALVTLFAPGKTLAEMLPAPIRNGGPTLRIEYVGTMPASGTGAVKTNATSPVVVDDDLLLIDGRGSLYRWDGNQSDLLFSASTNRPVELSATRFSVLNATPTGSGERLFVMFTSQDFEPGNTGTPIASSPRSNRSGYQVLYSYELSGSTLSTPEPLMAMEFYLRGHLGGGMVVLSDDSILYAVGDHGDAFQDGFSFPQDGVSHIGKILRIDPTDGSFEILAQGLRNPQQMVLSEHGGTQYIDFVDIGGNIAEEFNSIRLSDLLDTTTIENFGWGRNASDNFAREGTFYINLDGSAAAVAPGNEAGFIQPVGQWGRESSTFVAGSGPVSSDVSFSNITALFGDLVSGDVLASLGSVDQVAEEVFRVKLVDGQGDMTTLLALAGGRPDPRFFRFPNGSAGVLLERTGDFYRLTQIAVPEPQTVIAFLLGALCLPMFFRRGMGKPSR